MVPSPPITSASSQPPLGVGSSGDDLDRRSTAAARGRGRAASAASSRTTMPWPVSALQNARATSRASSRPVWASEQHAAGRRWSLGWSRVHLLTRHPRSGAAAHHGAVDVARRSIVGRPAAQPQEELDVARRARAAGWSPPSGRPSRGARPPSATPRTASARSAGSRTTPPLPTRSLPTSNCGLTISARSPSGAVTAEQRVEHQRERDERQVADHDVDRSADQLGGQVADVGAVVHHAPARPAAAARPAGRSRRRRPPPRAAPCRSSTSVNPPVDAPASRQRRPATTKPGGLERRQRAGQLVPAAGDVVGPVGVVGDHDRHVGGDAGGGLGRHAPRRP